jgi:carbon-monoxide dehydrogenase medium subunit
MKPARFDYYDPRTLDEAVALLNQYGGDSKVLAGGQSLMPLLNMRLARPQVVVDVNRIEGSNYVQPWDGGLTFGLTARQRMLQVSLVRERMPILAEMAQFIGHPQIRSRGTVCGSLAHADPAAELPALAAALEAELVATGPGGARTIPADDFFLGYLTTSLEPNEVLTEARFPAPPSDMAWGFQEVSRRYGDFALVGVVAGLALNPARDTITAARLSYFGVGPTPLRVRDAEAGLLGQRPGDNAFAAAGAIASQRVDPDNDIHATVAYRRSVAGALTRRALREAWHKLGGN